MKYYIYLHKAFSATDQSSRTFSDLLPVNEVWGKVIFSEHLSLCSQGGEGGLPIGGFPSWGSAFKMVCLQRGLHPGGLHPGESVSRGSASGGLHPGGLTDLPTPRIRKAGGMHPTGMLSCFH